MLQIVSFFNQSELIIRNIQRKLNTKCSGSNIEPRKKIPLL